MRICHIFIFLSVCLLSCQTDHTSCEFAGTYKTQGFYNGTTLNLRFDHSFKLTASHSNCFGGEKQYIVEGIFSTSDDKVFLSPSHFHIAQYQDGPEPGQQDRKLEQDTTYALSGIYDTMLEYEDTLQVVRWNGRMFILGANQIRPGMMFLTEKSVEKQYSVTVTDVFEKTSKGILIAVGVKPEPNVPLTTFEEKAEWDF